MEGDTFPSTDPSNPLSPLPFAEARPLEFRYEYPPKMFPLGIWL